MNPSLIRRASALGATMLVAALAVVGGAPAAHAADVVPLSEDTRTSVETFFDRYGVDEAAQDRLIDTIERGGRWEAMSARSVPVSVERSSSAAADIVVSRFGDGSVNVQSFERSGAASAISGCSRSGTAYSNCRVDFWYGLVSMSFRADYNLASGNNRITNQWGASWTIGGACSTNQNYFGRPSSRLARLEVQAQMCAAPYTTTFFLELKVGGNSASFNYG